MFPEDEAQAPLPPPRRSNTYAGGGGPPPRRQAPGRGGGGGGGGAPPGRPARRATVNVEPSNSRKVFDPRKAGGKAGRQELAEVRRLVQQGIVKPEVLEALEREQSHADVAGATRSITLTLGGPLGLPVTEAPNGTAVINDEP